MWVTFQAVREEGERHLVLITIHLQTADEPQRDGRLRNRQPRESINALGKGAMGYAAAGV